MPLLRPGSTRATRRTQKAAQSESGTPDPHTQLWSPTSPRGTRHRATPGSPPS
uniref:Uncharacterized protein n=1 Tax=Arundo donax TaxID=35708 RepID=A0A0A9FFN5_ARUDO